MHITGIVETSRMEARRHRRREGNVADKRVILLADVIHRTVLHNSTVSGYSQDHTWNIMVISVGDEFETYESVKCKIKKFPLIQIVTNLRIGSFTE